jgi:threonine dehydratase
MTIDYLSKILTARVYEVANETPLNAMPILSKVLSNQILIKREDLQPVFSFKLRGAFNKMAQLTEDELKRGVICASAGNHAQGVALSAQHLKTRAIIVMPASTPSVKVEAVRARGAEVVLHGESFDEAFAHSKQLEKELGLTFVHPFDDPEVIAGQGTIGMEILRQKQSRIDAIFVPIGGGGIAAGIAAYVKRIRPEIKVIGVEPKDSCAMYTSIKAGKKVRLEQVGLFADGLAVKEVGDETFRICNKLLDEVILVDTDQICAATKDIFQDTRSVVEPSGATALAGLKNYIEREGSKDQVFIALACGANLNFDRLRFIAERAELGECREAIFAATIPEKAGSLKRFCEVIGNRSVTEFNYRIASESKANIFVGAQVNGKQDAEELFAKLRAADIEVLDLTDDEMAKLHLRHMVGGHSANAEGERAYRFEFPERPGALMKFLSLMQPTWNISLFHYRNHGADYGRVFIGLQLAASADSEWKKFLENLGFPYQDESQNPAYRMFLGN